MLLTAPGPAAFSSTCADPGPGRSRPGASMQPGQRPGRGVSSPWGCPLPRLGVVQLMAGGCAEQCRRLGTWLGAFSDDESSYREVQQSQFLVLAQRSRRLTAAHKLALECSQQL